MGSFNLQQKSYVQLGTSDVYCICAWYAYTPLIPLSLSPPYLYDFSTPLTFVISTRRERVISSESITIVPRFKEPHDMDTTIYRCQFMTKSFTSLQIRRWHFISAHRANSVFLHKFFSHSPHFSFIFQIYYRAVCQLLSL